MSKQRNWQRQQFQTLYSVGSNPTLDTMDLKLTQWKRWSEEPDGTERNRRDPPYNVHVAEQLGKRLQNVLKLVQVQSCTPKLLIEDIVPLNQYMRSCPRQNLPRVTNRPVGQYLLLIVLFGRSVTVAQELPNLLVGVRFPPSEPF